MLKDPGGGHFPGVMKFKKVMECLQQNWTEVNGSAWEWPMHCSGIIRADSNDEQTSKCQHKCMDAPVTVP